MHVITPFKQAKNRKEDNEAFILLFSLYVAIHLFLLIA